MAEWRSTMIGRSLVPALVLALTVAGCSKAGSAGGGPSEPAPSAGSCTATACAFPGAEGFGTDTRGGRGGRVLIVTNLNKDGPGSFSEALLTEGPRIIVFRVSGVIDMRGESLNLNEMHSFVTVAGQTSPGGITILNGPMENYHSNFHDAVFRFLRFRSPGAGHAVAFNEANRFVFDHCDFSGGSDETFDVTFAHDFTLQWSTVTNSTSGGDSQNYGFLIAYKPTTRISLHHNLSAHHVGRCGAQIHWAGDGLPDPEGGAQLDLRNNVLHNCGFQQMYRAELEPATGTYFNLVGNYAKTGPDTPADSMFFGLGGQVYQSDNIYEGEALIMSPYYTDPPLTSPNPFPAVTTSPAVEAYAQVLDFAGAWPRDAMNSRTVAEVRAGTGQLGKQDDPLLQGGAAPPEDDDRDGVADEWERAHGMNPSDPADASQRDSSGYSKIELYVNELAQSLIGK
jgi:hypothetical protein